MLERYIPPPSILEYAELFSSQGQSVLVDRLSELSYHHGSLLFIYPTKTGAQAFTDHYLAPVLDPILLHIVNLNNLYYDLASDIGRLTSVATMLEFDDMAVKVKSLCASLTQRPRGHAPRSQYSLHYSSTGRVCLDQGTWREWFIQQEQKRIKATLNTYWGRARRLPVNKSVTGMTIAHQIVERLQKIPLGQEGKGSVGVGVEVGVFVIRRSLIST